MVELRGGNVRQQGSGLDPIADVDVALFDIAVGTRENIRRLKRRRGRGQGDRNFAVSGADRGHADVRDKSSVLLRGHRDLALGLVVAPASHCKTTREQQQHACGEQRASVPSPLAHGAL